MTRHIAWRITRLGKKKLAEFDSPSITQWGENLYKGELKCKFWTGTLFSWTLLITQIWLYWFNPAIHYFYKLTFFCKKNWKQIVEDIFETYNRLKISVPEFSAQNENSTKTFWTQNMASMCTSRLVGKTMIMDFYHFKLCLSLWKMTTYK